MSIPFHKMVGAGNDFIFIQESDLPSLPDKIEFIKTICDRNFGVGADGIAFFSETQTQDDKTSFRWDFYNNDGSHAEMCGNAARCAMVYNFIVNKTKNCELTTTMGLVSGHITESGSAVRWKVTNPVPEKKSITLKDGSQFDGWFIDTGVPHFVIIEEPHHSISAQTCLEIQQHQVFSPKETNVTLLTRQMQGPHLTRSFERGVRDFTFACGTGVIATGFVLRELNNSNQHSLKTPGGLLSVEIHNNQSITLEGHAQQSFQGQYL